MRVWCIYFFIVVHGFQRCTSQIAGSRISRRRSAIATKRDQNTYTRKGPHIHIIIILRSSVRTPSASILSGRRSRCLHVWHTKRYTQSFVSRSHRAVSVSVRFGASFSDSARASVIVRRGSNHPQLESRHWTRHVCTLIHRQRRDSNRKQSAHIPQLPTQHSKRVGCPATARPPPNLVQSAPTAAEPQCIDSEQTHPFPNVHSSISVRAAPTKPPATATPTTQHIHTHTPPPRQQQLIAHACYLVHGVCMSVCMCVCVLMCALLANE